LNSPSCEIFSKPKSSVGFFVIDYVDTDTWGRTATSTRTVIVDPNPSLATTSPSNLGVITHIITYTAVAQQASVSRIG
jgi:hypothetical protein